MKEHFAEVCQRLDGATSGNMFGKPCYKRGKKAFALFYQDEIVCKLIGEIREKALSIPESKLFNPKGKGKPMSNWVQIPADAQDQWAYFAEQAFLLTPTPQ